MAEILSLRRGTFFFAIGIGVFYGLLARLLFGMDAANDVFGIMAISFIFVVPIVVGYVTVHSMPPEKRAGWVQWIFWPWYASLFTIAAAIVLAWEGLICAVVWAPLFILLSSIGGIAAGLIRRSADQKWQNVALATFVILPFMIAPVERQFDAPEEFRVVESTIAIKSDPATIWQNIREVPEIRDEEAKPSLSQMIGFPKPIEATLIGEGVGAVRHATFAGNVLFIEKVTEWVPNETISFTIDVDPNIPPTTFDQHVVVGGRYFDVLTGSYHIEQVAPGECVLHLSSYHRLSTRFNFYTQLWTDFFMDDIQQHILQVIKQRCEGA